MFAGREKERKVDKDKERERESRNISSRWEHNAGVPNVDALSCATAERNRFRDWKKLSRSWPLNLPSRASTVQSTVRTSCPARECRGTTRDTTDTQCDHLDVVAGEQSVHLAQSRPSPHCGSLRRRVNVRDKAELHQSLKPMWVSHNPACLL